MTSRSALAAALSAALAFVPPAQAAGSARVFVPGGRPAGVPLAAPLALPTLPAALPDSALPGSVLALPAAPLGASLAAPAPVPLAAPALALPGAERVPAGLSQESPAG